MIGFYILIFILGLSFGSFLNAFEWRLNKGISLTKGTSKCPKCEEKIRWYDNIPLVSFFVLKSKCRNCKKNISWQYPLVELWMGLVFIFILFFHTIGTLSYIQIMIDCFIVWILTFIFVYDFKYMEVSDLVTLGGAGILFIISLFTNGDWVSMILGAVIGAGFFLIQFLISKGKWIGGGDIRIGILMGIILGWKLLLLALWIAYVVGAVVGIILLLFRKKKMKSEIPFGVFLTLATFVVMFWGQWVLDWYMSLIS